MCSSRGDNKQLATVKTCRNVCKESKRIGWKYGEIWVAASERNKAKKLLKRYNWAFATNNRRQWRTGMVKQEIDTSEVRLIKQVPRSILLVKSNEVDEMKRSDVIEWSSGPWSSPAFLVKKKSGSIRFCVDCRKPNDVTRKVSYPLSRIDDTLDSLAGTKWFTTTWATGSAGVYKTLS